METRASVAAAAVLILAAGGAQADGSAVAGAKKIRTLGCINCHGREGLSKLPEAPNLAGQVETYLASSLKAFHSGKRQNELMNTVSKNLTDADIADLAAYYAQIHVTVTPPPKS